MGGENRRWFILNKSYELYDMMFKSHKFQTVGWNDSIKYQLNIQLEKVHLAGCHQQGCKRIAQK